MSASAARRMADWVAGLEWKDVPTEHHRLTGMRVLDTLGLIFAGSATPAAAGARAIVAQQGESNVAANLFGGRAAPAWAAFAHGITAHCRDFDDTFQDSVVHPGSVVIPTALAIGEATDAQPAEIAVAIAAGYEVAARLGAVAGRRFHKRGLHATGIVGPFAATATAGRLMKLDGAAIAHAFGLTGSMSAGLMAFIADGAWSKWLHAGWAAHGGIIAAQLASTGFRGPASVLDGRHNLYAALLAGEDVDTSALNDGLGQDWQGADAHFKYYPCAHVIQPYLDAAIAVRIEAGLDPSTIAGADCRIAPWAAQIVSEPRAQKIRPDTEMAAIASLPYLLAVALQGGVVTLDALSEAMRTRADLLALTQRITHTNDPSLGDGFDGVLALRLRDGTVIERSVSSAPPDMKKLVAKYYANARTSIGDTLAKRIEHAALADPLPDFGCLFDEFDRL